MTSIPAYPFPLPGRLTPEQLSALPELFEQASEVAFDGAVDEILSLCGWKSTSGRQNAVHEALCQGLAKLGKTPNVVEEIANLNAILDHVRQGHGCSVIPVSGVHACIGDNALKLHRLRRPAISVSLFIAQPAISNDPLSCSELEVLRQVIVEQLRVFEDDVENAVAADN